VVPNRAVQLTPLARFLGWAQFTRQNAPACWQRDNPQPPVGCDTLRSLRSTGRPHAHCLAAASAGVLHAPDARQRRS